MHKEIRNTLTYIVVASFVMITAVWQAQVSAKRDIEARHRALPPPPKTKRAIRPVPQTFTGDVVVDYVERCEKGMTDREIGWIVEDFENAGLDHDIMDVDHTNEEFFERRTVQQRWYFEALVDGLRLTSEQSAQMKAKLAALFDRAKADFIAELDAGAAPSEMVSVEPFCRFTVPTWWLLGNGIAYKPSDKQKFMPWSLCNLTPQQQKTTAMRWTEKRERPDGGRDPLPLKSAPGPTAESRQLDFLLPDSPPGDVLTEIPRELADLNSIFPLIRSQKFSWQQDPFAVSAHPILANRNRLHPSQFKILLLLYPGMAAEIQNALASESH